jgi:selenocysteine lyase/cysteine desulfurase
MNATHGLNMAIKSLISPGGQAVISGYEHNSVLRPLRAAGAEIRIAKSELFEPESAVSAFDSAITDRTELMVCNHVSNVFGYVLPIERIAAMCADRGIPFILDASQSAGAIDIDASALKAAFIAMPGHKGLYGPQGTGLLICGRVPKTLMEGGTGSNSISPDMPSFLPDRAEAGTHNMPGIAGLKAGIDYVLERTPEAILRREKSLIAMAGQGLASIPGVQVWYSPHGFAQSGVISFLIRGMDCEETARQLADRGIAVRAGLHCSPLAHSTVGTAETGTVRLSVSDMSTARHIASLLNAVECITRKRIVNLF